MIEAICPKDPNHKEFAVTAHVTQDWIVDEKGNYIKTTNECVEVTHTPNSEDIWTCAICGTQAILKR